MSQQYAIIEIDEYGNESVLPGTHELHHARDIRDQLETENADRIYEVRVAPNPKNSGGDE